MYTPKLDQSDRDTLDRIRVATGAVSLPAALRELIRRADPVAPPPVEAPALPPPMSRADAHVAVLDAWAAICAARSRPALTAVHALSFAPPALLGALVEPFHVLGAHAPLESTRKLGQALGKLHGVPARDGRRLFPYTSESRTQWYVAPPSASSPPSVG